MKLTDTNIKALPLPESGNKIHYDDDVKGFGVRVTAKGAKAFIINYRIGRRERRYTIGAFPDWKTTAAREYAKSLKRKIDDGTDPLAERQRRYTDPTVDDLCNEFIAEHLPAKRPATQRDYKHIIDTYIRPDLKHRLVSEVTHGDALAVFRKVTKTGKTTTANRVVAVMSAMFNMARKLEWLDRNPAEGIERNAETKRERFLSSDELGRLLDALTELEDKQAANIFRLMLLTGCRKSEALGARWDMMDLSKGTWTKPAHYTKQKKLHSVPLSAPARQLLAEIHAAQGDAPSDYVFPAWRESTKKDAVNKLPHRSNVKNAWAALTKAAQLEDFRMHDLRHSYASFLVSDGLSLPVIGRLLGHTQAATTQRYAHLEHDALRRATDRVGDRVTNAQLVQKG